MIRRTGMTLLEVTISMTILSVVLLGTMTFMDTVVRTTEVERNLGDLTLSGNAALETMAENLRPAMIPEANSLPLNGDGSITFLVPVDPDGDGDTLDDSLEIEWGSRREDLGDCLDKSHTTPGDPDTFTTTFRFVKTGTFDEAARQIDLNGNGTRTEVFDVGHLEKVYSAAQGGAVPERVFPLTADCVVRLPKAAGSDLWPDIDHDGENDPLFHQSGSKLTVKFFLARVDASLPVLIPFRTTIDLRNIFTPNYITRIVPSGGTPFLTDASL